MVWESNSYTRREVLKVGAAGVGLLALGPLAAACGSESETSTSATGVRPQDRRPADHRSRTSSRRCRPSGSTRTTCAVSSGNVYTLDKMYETLYVTDAERQAAAVAGRGARGEQPTA